MRIYKPQEFSKLVNCHVKTLQRWDFEGKLKAHRNAGNRRYYTHDQFLELIGLKATKNDLVVAYSRVSSSAQKSDLINQRQALEQFCLASGLAVNQWLQDIGSGLNYQRKHFIQLFNMVEQGEVSCIIIAHKDRLVRFGYEWFAEFCKKHGTKIIVMNQESLSPTEEMTKDLLSIIHCFSSRLYGLRKYKNKFRTLVREKAAI